MKLSNLQRQEEEEKKKYPFQDESKGHLMLGRNLK
jgi:hypothetical protein